MGWIRDDGQDWSYEHEGYVLAQIKDNGAWRDLGMGDEERDTSRDVMMLQVACECGWRSQRQTAPLGTEWFPYTVMFRTSETYKEAEGFENAAGEMWERHMAESHADSRRSLMSRGHEIEREHFARRLGLPQSP